MKKLIIFFAILFSMGVFAQNTDKSPTYLGTNDMFHYMYQATLNGLRVILVADSTVAAGNATASNQTTIIARLDTLPSFDHARFFRTVIDTTSDGNDSFDIGAVVSRWFKFTIVVDDTVEFSFTSAFTSGQTYKMLSSETYISGKISSPFLGVLYYRRYVTPGGTGVPNVRIIFEGY